MIHRGSMSPFYCFVFLSFVIQFKWITTVAQSYTGISGGAVLDGQVRDILRVNNTLYVVSEFKNCGLMPSQGIVTYDFDKVQWNPLGSGTMTSSSAAGESVITDGTNIYVSGSFSSIGGVTASNVARWNGTAWNPMGKSTDTPVAITGAPRRLLWANGTLWVFGESVTNGVAIWNTSSSKWARPTSTLTVSSTAIKPIFSVLWYKGLLLIGGSMTSVSPSVGSGSSHYVTAWNGTIFERFGTSLTKEMTQLAEYRDNIYGVGYAGEFWIYNGTTNKWSIAAPSVGSGYALFILNDFVYIAGTLSISSSQSGVVKYDLVNKKVNNSWSSNGAFRIFVDASENIFVGGWLTSLAGTSNLKNWGVITPTIWPTPSTSASPSIQPTRSSSATGTVSARPTFSATASVTRTSTSSVTRTRTANPTVTANPSVILSVSSTGTSSASSSSWPSASASASVSSTETSTSTGSDSNTPTPSSTVSTTPTVSETSTPSSTTSTTPTISESNTPTPSSTVSATPTISESNTPTPSTTISVTPTISETSSSSPSSTISTTPTVSDSVTPSISESATSSPSPLQTVSILQQDVNLVYAVNVVSENNGNGTLINSTNSNNAGNATVNSSLPSPPDPQTNTFCTPSLVDSLYNALVDPLSGISYVVRKQLAITVGYAMKNIFITGMIDCYGMYTVIGSDNPINQFEENYIDVLQTVERTNVTLLSYYESTVSNRRRLHDGSAFSSSPFFSTFIDLASKRYINYSPNFRTLQQQQQSSSSSSSSFSNRTVNYLNQTVDIAGKLLVIEMAIRVPIQIAAPLENFIEDILLNSDMTNLTHSALDLLNASILVTPSSSSSITGGGGGGSYNGVSNTSPSNVFNSTSSTYFTIVNNSILLVNTNLNASIVLNQNTSSLSTKLLDIITAVLLGNDTTVDIFQKELETAINPSILFFYTVLENVTLNDPRNNYTNGGILSNNGTNNNNNSSNDTTTISVSYTNTTFVLSVTILANATHLGTVTVVTNNVVLPTPTSSPTISFSSTSSSTGTGTSSITSSSTCTPSVLPSPPKITYYQDVNIIYAFSVTDVLNISNINSSSVVNSNTNTYSNNSTQSNNLFFCTPSVIASTLHALLDPYTGVGITLRKNLAYVLGYPMKSIFISGTVDCRGMYEPVPDTAAVNIVNESTLGFYFSSNPANRRRLLQKFTPAGMDLPVRKVAPAPSFDTVVPNSWPTYVPTIRYGNFRVMQQLSTSSTQILLNETIDITGKLLVVEMAVRVQQQIATEFATFIKSVLLRDNSLMNITTAVRNLLNVSTINPNLLSNTSNFNSSNSLLPSKLFDVVNQIGKTGNTSNFPTTEIEIIPIPSIPLLYTAIRNYTDPGTGARNTSNFNYNLTATVLPNVTRTGRITTLVDPSSSGDVSVSIFSSGSSSNSFSLLWLLFLIIIPFSCCILYITKRKKQGSKEEESFTKETTPRKSTKNSNTKTTDTVVLPKEGNNNRSNSSVNLSEITVRMPSSSSVSNAPDDKENVSVKIMDPTNSSTALFSRNNPSIKSKDDNGNTLRPVLVGGKEDSLPNPDLYDSYKASQRNTSVSSKSLKLRSTTSRHQIHSKNTFVAEQDGASTANTNDYNTPTKNNDNGGLNPEIISASPVSPASPYEYAMESTGFPENTNPTASPKRQFKLKTSAFRRKNFVPQPTDQSYGITAVESTSSTPSIASSSTTNKDNDGDNNLSPVVDSTENHHNSFVQQHHLRTRRVKIVVSRHQKQNASRPSDAATVDKQ